MISAPTATSHGNTRTIPPMTWARMASGRPTRGRREPQPLIFAIAVCAIVLCAAERSAQADLIPGWAAVTCAAISPSVDFEHGCVLGFPGANAGDVKSTGTLEPAVASVSLSGARASAYQTAGGWNAAAAQARSDDAGFEVAGASSAYLRVSVFNTGPDPVSMPFHFFITHAELSLDLSTDFRAPSGEQGPVAEIVASLMTFDASGRPDSPAATLWRYHAALVGVNAGLFGLLFNESVFDPQGIGKPVATIDRSIGVAHVELAPFARSLSLGDLVPGADLTFEYRVEARVFTGRPVPFFDPESPPTTGAVAWIADPFGLDGDLTLPPFPLEGFSLAGQSLASLLAVPEAPRSGVPLPATLLLVAGAIGCVALSRRLRGSRGRAQGADLRRARRATAQPIG